MSAKKAVLAGVIAVAGERGVTMAYGSNVGFVEQGLAAVPVMGATYVVDMALASQSSIMRTAAAGALTYGLQVAYSGDSSPLWAAIGAGSYFLADYYVKPAGMKRGIQAATAVAY
jgi:hypothetical protein